MVTSKAMNNNRQQKMFARKICAKVTKFHGVCPNILKKQKQKNKKHIGSKSPRAEWY